MPCCPGLALGMGVLGEGGWGTYLDVACEFPEVIGLIPLAVFAMLPPASSGVGGSRGGGSVCHAAPDWLWGWGF